MQLIEITQENPAMVGYALGNGEPVAAEVQDLIEGVLSLIMICVR
jgi:hypothetical protein